MRLVFMGTPDFAVPSLEILVRNGYEPIAVVTGPDRPRGRGRQVTPTPVKKAALALGVNTILQPASVKDAAFAESIAGLAPDVIVVVAFKILPPAVFLAARLGAFNLHGSLLPKYRGAAPIHHAVMAGERETGVTTFFLKEVVDTGNIILTRRMEIGAEETTGDVHDRMKYVGAEVVLETVRLVDTGEVATRMQDDAVATPAPKVFRKHGQVDWHRPAHDIHNLIRGLSPVPAAWTQHGEKTLKLLRSRPADGAGRPGEVLSSHDRLVVGCRPGAVEIVELQLEGRRVQDARRFLRGYRLQEGEILGR